MKRSLNLPAVLCLLAAVVMPLSWWLTRTLPMPVTYEYATFRWPLGTRTATCTFYPLTAGASGYVVRELADLGEILKAAHDEQGYDYYSTAGDTVILQRVRPGGSPAHGANGQTFEVTDQQGPPQYRSPLGDVYLALDAGRKTAAEQAKLIQDLRASQALLLSNQTAMQHQLDRQNARTTNLQSTGLP